MGHPTSSSMFALSTGQAPVSSSLILLSAPWTPTLALVWASKVSNTHPGWEEGCCPVLSEGLLSLLWAGLGAGSGSLLTEEQ